MRTTRALCAVFATAALVVSGVALGAEPLEANGQLVDPVLQTRFEHIAKDRLVGSDRILRSCRGRLRAHAAGPE